MNFSGVLLNLEQCEMKKQVMSKYLYLFLLGVVLSNCTLTDNEQPIPSYLEVTDVSVSTNQNQGAATHNLKDIWVYADNQLLGTFEVPCKIPVISNSETTEFLIFPGFRNNGEQSRSFTYNLMDQIRFTETLSPGDVTTKSLTFKYKDEAIFDFVEGFEGGAHIFTRDLDDDDETRIVTSTEDKKSGIQSGKFLVSKENPILSVGCIFDYNRADNAGLDTYLEMDYKNDIPFAVGVLYEQEGSKVSQPLIVLNPSEDWNKIYIDFTSILSSPAISTYSVYFTTDIETLQEDESTIYFDNLKLVHL